MFGFIGGSEKEILMFAKVAKTIVRENKWENRRIGIIYDNANGTKVYEISLIDYLDGLYSYFDLPEQSRRAAQKEVNEIANIINIWLSGKNVPQLFVDSFDDVGEKSFRMVEVVERKKSRKSAGKKYHERRRAAF